MNHKLILKLVPRDIDILFRIGKFPTDSNRPVICKRVSSEKERHNCPKKLKGFFIVIREEYFNCINVNNPQARLKVLDMLIEHDLVDCWREQHTKPQHFTWFE